MFEISREIRRYRLTGTTSLLGSNPANPEIHSQYVAAKAATVEQQAMEEALLPGTEELAETVRDIKERGLTVFLRNNHGEVVLGQWIIKGFMKACFAGLKDQFGVGNPKSKLDNLLFVAPGFIRVTQGGEPIREVDTFCERSLRAETMQGPRVSLVSSEEIDAPWEIEFALTLMDNSGTAKSHKVDWDRVEAALTYGQYKGLGQWRNGGHGSFEWERIA